MDCSLYKQFILILFSIFRLIFIYFSFFTELVLLSLYDTEFILFHRVLLSFYDTEFIFLDTELVLFFICSDLINFIFILLAFHLSCTVVSGSWI